MQETGKKRKETHSVSQFGTDWRGIKGGKVVFGEREDLMTWFKRQIFRSRSKCFKSMSTQMTRRRIEMTSIEDVNVT